MAEPIEITIDEKFLVELAVTDRAGNPAAFDAPPEWDGSPAEFISVEPKEDGMSAYVVSGDIAGQVGMVTARGDADLGDGVREIIGTLQVNLKSGEAKFVQMVASAPEPKDAPPEEEVVPETPA